MIRTMLYRPATREVATGDEKLLLDWQREPDTLVWVDLADNPPLSEQTLLVERFGLHPLAIQDAHRTRHQPKIGVFSKADYLWVIETQLHKYEVEIPFPQRNLHIRSWADDARVPPAADARGSV